MVRADLPPGQRAAHPLRAVVLGSVLGFFLSFTNIYIGLKTGWFLGVNLTAAILSYAVWTGLANLAREAPRWPTWKKRRSSPDRGCSGSC